MFEHCWEKGCRAQNASHKTMIPMAVYVSILYEGAKLDKGNQRKSKVDVIIIFLLYFILVEWGSRTRVQKLGSHNSFPLRTLQAKTLPSPEPAKYVKTKKVLASRTYDILFSRSPFKKIEGKYNPI